MVNLGVRQFGQDTFVLRNYSQISVVFTYTRINNNIIEAITYALELLSQIGLGCGCYGVPPT